MKRLKKSLQILFVIIALWVVFTSVMQRVKQPTLTASELFFLIPQNFILNFK